jgi:hypothetical protein
MLDSSYRAKDERCRDCGYGHALSYRSHSQAFRDTLLYHRMEGKAKEMREAGGADGV